MRHYLSLLAGGIVLAAVFVGCTAEVENPEVDITSIRCSIAQIDVEEDFATGILDTLSVTKATISGSSFLWSAGDRIGILPNTGSQIYFAVTNGAGTSSASFDGGDWAMKSTGTFYAYYPLYPDIFLTKDHVPVSYIGQTQSGNNNTLHTGEYWTLFTGGTTAVGNTLNFSFNHMTSFFKTYVTVPAGTYTKISFTAPSNIFIKEGYFDLSAQTPAIVGTTMTDELTLNLENVTFAEETELSGYLVVAPVDIAGVPITVTVFKDGVATYEYTLAKANNMVASKTYAFRATVLTQLASSVSQANTLFASGATAVTITEPLTADATVVLPDTGDAVTLTLPTTASSSKLTVSYDPGASSYPATLSITGPEGADLDIQTPSSTVTVNGVAYDQITSRTAANTCIIPAGVTVTTLKVIQGGVQVYGTVSQIDLSEQEDDAIINVSGTVSSLLGEDSEEYSPATGVSLNQSSINLNVGATETLTATVAPYGAYPNVIWTSSDEAVATVSSAGVVTAVAAGSATITAKSISGGFTASCEITVEHDSANDYFTITSTGSTGVAIVYHNSPSAITLEYKKGDGAWAPYTIIDYHDFYDNNVRVGDVIELADGESLQFRAGESGNQSFSQGGYASGSTMQRYYNVVVDGEGTIDVSGNIMSLVDRTMQRTNLESYMFHGLFERCTKLVDASHLILPAMSLANYCYMAMFAACTSLTAPPSLPATTLANFCYYAMFDTCISMTTAPDLPATVLADCCYEGMFYWCQSLTEAPLLPATTLARSCYRDMFNGCSNLRYVKAYYTTYLSGDSYSTSNWLSYVSSSGTFVRLPAAKWDVRGNNGIPEGWSIEYDDVDLGLPTIGDVIIESVAYKTVSVQSSLTSDSYEITRYGFYYGTSANSITTRINASDLNAGAFSKEITGLTPGTTYYIKAYATNEAGTVESDVVSFTTPATYGTLNGYEWVDIGIRKSMFDSSIEPGSSEDRRIVFAKQNIGASSQYGTGYFFRGNELYGWKYSGSTSSSTQITSSNLVRVDNEGNTIRAFQYDNFYWDDEDLDFVIEYPTGDAISYYYGSGWEFMPKDLIKKLYCHSLWYDTLPSTVSRTFTSLTGLSLTFEFTSSRLTISNSDLGTSIVFPYGSIEGWWGSCYYSSGWGYYWGKGDIREIYGGGIKPGWVIMKDSMGDNYDPDIDNYTTWQYAWVADGTWAYEDYGGLDVYRGCPIRAVAELPL